MISDNSIIGYYNISTSCIENDEGIRIGGSVYINCLAVDKHYQKVKRGEYYISDILLADCLNRVDNIFLFVFILPLAIKGLSEYIAYAPIKIISLFILYHICEKNIILLLIFFIISKFSFHKIIT